MPIPEAEDIFHVYTARHPATSRLDSLAAVHLNQVTQSSAISRSKEDAEALAVFEALERWSSIADGTESTCIATYQELEQLHLRNPERHLKAVWINDIQLFSEKQQDAQFAYTRVAPISAEDPIAWMRAWSINAKTWKWVPAATCLYGWKDDENHEAFVDSRGVAAGPTLDFCVWNGLLELIQTDTVAIWHANRLRKPEVDLTSFATARVDDIVRVHNQLERDLWVIDVSSDIQGVCVMAAISRDRKTGNVVKGFGSDPDPVACLHRAVMECSQMLPNVLGPENNQDDQSEAPLAFNNHDYLVPHVTLPRRTQSYYQNLHQPVRTIGELTTMLTMHDLESLVIDLTRPDIGLPVARVLVPGLRPWFNRLAPGRLFSVPVLTEEQVHPLDEQDMNQSPVEDWSTALHGDAICKFLEWGHK